MDSAHNPLVMGQFALIGAAIMGCLVLHKPDARRVRVALAVASLLLVASSVARFFVPSG